MPIAETCPQQQITVLFYNLVALPLCVLFCVLTLSALLLLRRCAERERGVWCVRTVPSDVLNLYRGRANKEHVK